jgi:hypothetical protein
MMAVYRLKEHSAITGDVYGEYQTSIPAIITLPFLLPF